MTFFFYLLLKEKGILSFPLHSLQYFSLVLINAYLFVQKMMKVCTEKNKISRCFLEKMMKFFSFIGIECYLLMSDVTNLNMCI